jgi:predicted ribosomally synthesized peptide with nif11-like leader
MTKNLKALIEKVSADEELKKKAEALNDIKDEEEAKAAVIKLAAEAGITITEADFAPEEGEINDDELEAVAGGKDMICVLSGAGKSGFCLLVGVDTEHKDCICVAGGLGK